MQIAHRGKPWTEGMGKRSGGGREVRQTDLGVSLEAVEMEAPAGRIRLLQDLPATAAARLLPTGRRTRCDLSHNLTPVRAARTTKLDTDDTKRERRDIRPIPTAYRIC